jgi:NADH:ubiquinone oxidoreductase subunit
MPMKHKTLFSLVLVSRIVIALTILFVALPVVGARSPEPARSMETRDLFSAAASVPGARFVHTATAANITANWTYIDHPLTNNNPNAIVLVTQNWNPGGVGSTYNDHSIGVYYSNSEQKWAIFNQDTTAGMPTGAAFNVLIPATGAGAFVHTATAANITGNWTTIDHPLTNDNPNAIVLVTQNWNPGGVSGTYNDHPIGVWYYSSIGKWAIFNQDIASMPTGADFNVLIPPTGADVFVHSATAANITANWTTIDHPLTNNNPNAIVLITQNWNPGGVGDIYNNHPIGVWYISGAKKWAVFNQDLAAMPAGAAFNVLVATTDSAAFVHTATATNITGNWTPIDHPLTNDNPNAIVLVTQNWNPGGVGSTYNNHPIGVWYSGGAKKWAVFNQDLASMPDGAAFNVLIPAVDTSVFVHIARAVNITSNWTTIDHPLTNDKPDAVVLVTQNWNPSGVGNIYNNHAIGVWYDGVEKKWAVFNQDLAAMPAGAAFNVLVATTDSAAFVHTATAANISGNWTPIDHPLTNDNPNAIVLVTQNWNPGGVGSTYNNHPIGVWYSGGAKKWAIFNQDLASMPDGAAFNVIVIVYKVYLPLVLRGT